MSDDLFVEVALDPVGYAEELKRLRAALVEAREALAEVQADVGRAATNNVVWPGTVRMVDAALARIDAALGK